MRIAVVTSSYPASPGDPSGHFVETEARLLARDADVVVIAPAPPAPSSHARRTVPAVEDGLVVWRLPGGEAFGWPGMAARVRQRPWRVVAATRWAANAARLLRTLPSVDRVVAHWAVPSAIIAIAGTSLPLEVVSHGADVRLLCGLPAAVRHVLIGSIAARAARWTFVAAPLRDELLGAASCEQSRRVLAIAAVRPAPIDLVDVGRESLMHRRAHGDRALLVCVGRLVASKRFDRAIDRAAAWPRARVVVVGDGPEREKLEAHARARRVDALFVGKVSRQEALAWIGAADAVLHASQTEGLSTVVREAEALGVRVECVP